MPFCISKEWNSAVTKAMGVGGGIYCNQFASDSKISNL
jgi:hypothetical protein